MAVLSMTEVCICLHWCLEELLGLHDFHMMCWAWSLLAFDLLASRLVQSLRQPPSRSASKVVRVGLLNYNPPHHSVPVSESDSHQTATNSASPLSASAPKLAGHWPASLQHVYASESTCYLIALLCVSCPLVCSHWGQQSSPLLPLDSKALASSFH